MRLVNIKECLLFGWRVFKKQPLFLILSFLIAFLISGGFSFVLPLTVKPSSSFIFLPLEIVINTFLSIALVNICLRLAKGKKAKFSDLFTEMPRFFPFLGTQILVMLIVWGGLLLLIVPGIIWAIKYTFYPYFVIDQKKGVMQSLKGSGRITTGYKWRIMWFVIVLFFVNVLGLLCLGIGLLITVPVTSLATAHLYLKLRDHTLNK